jgi:hypothetical protein
MRSLPIAFKPKKASITDSEFRLGSMENSKFAIGFLFASTNFTFFRMKRGVHQSYEQYAMFNEIDDSIAQHDVSTTQKESATRKM